MNSNENLKQWAEQVKDTFDCLIANLPYNDAESLLTDVSRIVNIYDKGLNRAE